MGMGHIRIRVVWVSLIALGGSFRQLKRPKRYLDAIEAKVGEGEPSSVLYPPLEFGLKLEGPALVLRTCPRALPVDRSLPARDPVDNLLGPVPLFSTPFGSEIFDELPSGVYEYPSGATLRAVLSTRRLAIDLSRNSAYHASSTTSDGVGGGKGGGGDGSGGGGACGGGGGGDGGDLAGEVDLSPPPDPLSANLRDGTSQTASLDCIEGGGVGGGPSEEKSAIIVKAKHGLRKLTKTTPITGCASSQKPLL